MQLFKNITHLSLCHPLCLLFIVVFIVSVVVSIVNALSCKE